MGFKADTSAANEGYDVKPEGEYEVIIDSWKYKTTPKGKEAIGLKYIIRNDIEQPCKNGVIFHDIWKKHEPTDADLAAGGYNYGQLMAIYTAVGLPNSKDYNTVDEMLNDFVGEPVKITLAHELYNNKKQERVRKHSQTAHNQVRHTPKQSTGYTVPPPANYANYTAPPIPAQSGSEDDDYPF